MIREFIEVIKEVINTIIGRDVFEVKSTQDKPNTKEYRVNLDIIRRILKYYEINLDDDTVAASKLMFKDRAECEVYYEYFREECAELFSVIYDEICLPDGYKLGIRLMPKNDNIVIRLRRYEIDRGVILNESTLNLYTE